MRLKLYMTLPYLALILTTSPVQATDDNLPERVRGTAPKLILTSKLPFYDVERCIVFSESEIIPYRTPDRPLQSTFISTGVYGDVLWLLSQSADGLVTLRSYGGHGGLGRIRHCFD